MIFMIEAQCSYLLQALRALDRRGASLDVRPATQERFNAAIQRDLARAVWSAGGCKSWYLDEHGKNRTLWPGFTWRYWLRTRRFDRDAYL